MPISCILTPWRARRSHNNPRPQPSRPANLPRSPPVALSPPASPLRLPSPPAALDHAPVAHSASPPLLALSAAFAPENMVASSSATRAPDSASQRSSASFGLGGLFRRSSSGGDGILSPVPRTSSPALPQNHQTTTTLDPHTLPPNPHPPPPPSSVTDNSNPQLSPVPPPPLPPHPQPLAHNPHGEQINDDIPGDDSEEEVYSDGSGDPPLSHDNDLDGDGQPTYNEVWLPKGCWADAARYAYAYVMPPFVALNPAAFIRQQAWVPPLQAWAPLQQAWVPPQQAWVPAPCGASLDQASFVNQFNTMTLNAPAFNSEWYADF